MPRVNAGERSLYYEVEGVADAPPLLLLNSLGTDLGMWDAQMPLFRQQFRVIRYDMRGHGRSSPDASNCEVSSLAADALAVLDDIGVSRAHWCGLSVGGMTALWAAAHRGERVLGLALCNTSAHLPPATAWRSRAELVEREGMVAVADVIPLRWFSEAFRTRQAIEVDRIRSMLLTADARSYAAVCDAIAKMDQRDDLIRVGAPTLVISGALDPATPPAHAEALQAAIPRSSLVSLAAAHLSNIEQPAAFGGAVVEHFSRVT